MREVLNSDEIQRNAHNKEDEDKLLYVRGRSEWKGRNHQGKDIYDDNGYRRCFLCHREGHYKLEFFERIRWHKHQGHSVGQASLIS